MKHKIINAVKKSIICLFNLFKRRGVISKILTGPLKGAKWDYYSSAPSFYFGSFEIKKVRQFIEAIKNAKVVFDIGANVGYYSLVASKFMQAGAQAYAFEPSRRNVEALERHLSVNGATNVKVVAKAVSDLDKKVFLQENALGVLDSISENSGSYEVDSVSLDRFCQQAGVFPDVIKLDVEGAEKSVLEGAKELLQNRKPAIFLSTHSPELERECIAMLEAAGYKVGKIEENELLAR